MTTPMLLQPTDLPVGSPLWWVHRLYAQIQADRPQLDLMDQYYRGDHPLPWLPEQAAEEFGRLLPLTRTNYMGLVVDSKAERVQVEGFRVGDADDDESKRVAAELWRWWLENGLDADSDLGFLEAMIGGRSYLLAAPNPNDPTTPLITVEHPSQAIVEYEPGSSRRRVAAGLKVWADDWTGRAFATLYLPGAIYKFQSSPLVVTEPYLALWQPRDGVDPVTRNPLGVVPLVEMPNNPRLLTGGRSLLEDLIPIQDRINKTVADRLMTQDFGAFPQKWATGFPQVDADGAAVDPIDLGQDRMVSTDAVETRFGQFEAAPLDPYSMAKREDVKDIASRSRTPAQYLLGELNNVNGETLKATEVGHIAVIRQMHRDFGAAIKRTLRIAALAAGAQPNLSAEVRWTNPEYRTDAEVTDAAVKKLQSRIASLRQAREDVGYSATQISRLEADDVLTAQQGGLAELAAMFPALPAA